MKTEKDEPKMDKKLVQILDKFFYGFPVDCYFLKRDSIRLGFDNLTGFSLRIPPGTYYSNLLEFLSKHKRWIEKRKQIFIEFWRDLNEFFLNKKLTIFGVLFELQPIENFHKEKNLAGSTKFKMEFVNFNNLVPDLSGQLVLNRQIIINFNDNILYYKKTSILNEFVKVKRKINSTRGTLDLIDIIHYQDATLYVYKLIAKKIFRPWISHISNKIGIKFNNLRITSAKTRWGSCSSKNNINLSAQLVKKSPAFISKVMVHELCHVIYKDHSQNFKSLLREKFPWDVE